MRWSDKHPTEIIVVGIDFADLVNTGETIIAVNRSITVIRGADENPESMLLGPAALVDQSAQQWLQGGVAEVGYCLAFTIDTDAGRRIVESGVFLVKSRCG